MKEIDAKTRRELLHFAADLESAPGILERWETIAEEFYQASGFLRPGKSYPMEAPCFNEEERHKAWNEWVKARNARLGQALRSLLETP